MPQFNFDNQHREQKKSLVPKSTTHITGEVLVTLKDIEVVPMGTNGYKRVFITYECNGEDVVTEFNPPSPNSPKYALKDKEGNVNMNINLKYDSSSSLFNEDLWKSFDPFYKLKVNAEGKMPLCLGKEDLYYFEDINVNKTKTTKGSKAIPKYGILYAFEKLMAAISPYTFNKDSNMDISEWTLFSNSYKHDPNLLTTVTDKNIKEFGYYKTVQWVTNSEGKNVKVILPLDTVAVETRKSKAGNDYTVCLPIEDNPAYIESLKTKILSFSKKYVLVDGQYKEVTGDTKGYPAAFYSYFEMLSKYLETLKAKEAKSLGNKFKIFLYGDVNKFTTTEGKEITTPVHVIDYTNTNRRWFFPYSALASNNFTNVFVPLLKYNGELMDYASARLLAKQVEFDNLFAHEVTEDSKSLDTAITFSDDMDDLPF